MNLVLGVMYFLIGQTIVWFATNAQFFNDWASRKPWILTIIAAPVTYLFIIATKQCASYFDGAIWPGRFIGFGTGMIAFTLLTYFVMGESVSSKTIISLIISVVLVYIQIFWK